MNNETKLPDEVIKCVAFLVDDNDNDSVQSELVGINTKPKSVNINQQGKRVDIISEKV